MLYTAVLFCLFYSGVKTLIRKSYGGLLYYNYAWKRVMGWKHNVVVVVVVFMMAQEIADSPKCYDTVAWKILIKLIEKSHT